MTRRCGNEDSDITAKAKDLFKSFLDDIYYLTSLPSYPASQLIIIVLSKLLVVYYFKMIIMNYEKIEFVENFSFFYCNKRNFQIPNF